eukprot:TRINITY_DN236_c0_g3_i1.p1 TRINITY_DN236_c0_g3~~TRINITY_DN236_c0_g3_i1.p1  ORF type:complete len:152 (-),score=6.80 TRINITY_DN236_c0_g3_i1:65-499(-)
MSDGRTIYVGNLDSNVNEQVLTTFFNCCGQVSKTKLAGDANYPARFAFVEFSEPTAAQSALTLTGTRLGEREIRVNLSKNTIATNPGPPRGGGGHHEAGGLRTGPPPQSGGLGAPPPQHPPPPGPHWAPAGRGRKGRPPGWERG